MLAVQPEVVTPKQAVIYGLVHPKTGRTRYVGKTINDPKRRLSNHEFKARSGRYVSPLGRWLHNLAEQGLHARVVVLAQVEGRWQDAERKWIRTLRAQGLRLLNQTPGGNGAHTRAALAAPFAEQLGRVSDGRIAEQAGLCRETITYHRRRAGIPASNDRSRVHGWTKGQRAHNRVELPSEVLTLLGTTSDYGLAKQAGVSKQTLALRRRELGIPAFTGPKNNKKESAHHSSKLTTEKVQAARQRHAEGTSGYALAKEYGVHFTTMHAALHRKTWRSAC